MGAARGFREYDEQKPQKRGDHGQVQFRCPKCRTKYTTDEIFLGKQGRCKNCGQTFRLVDAKSDPPKPAYPTAAVPQGDGAAALKDWSAGQVILDDYVIERELGAGGMGKVYLLWSRSTREPFAVKRALHRNENNRRNFLAELRTWIDLPEHPHLVACRFFQRWETRSSFSPSSWRAARWRIGFGTGG